MVKRALSLGAILAVVASMNCSQDAGVNDAQTSVAAKILWKVGNAAALTDSIGVDSVRVTLSSSAIEAPATKTAPFSAHSIVFPGIRSGSDVTLDVEGIGPLGDTLFQGSASQSGISGAEVLVAITATQVTPLGPDSLKVTALSYKTTRLTWRDRSSNESFFVVERGTDTGSFSIIDTLRLNSTVLDDTGLNAHTLYRYRVYGVNETGRSIANGEIATVTTPSQTAWAPPRFTLGCRQSLADVDTLLVGQEFRRKLSAIDDNGYSMTFSVSLPLAKQTADSVSWKPSSADKGAHPVWVKVADSVGVGDSIDWQIAVIDTPVPAAPIISYVAPDSGAVRVIWNSVGGASSYNLYYKAGTVVDKTSGTKIAGAISPQTVAGLTTGTQYAFAVSAQNALGESALSGVKTAIPQVSGSTVTDVDGNSYRTVIIGTQEWMAENLRTTRLNDSTAISLVVDSVAWGAATVPGYCWYQDSIDPVVPYGALYNLYAVNTHKLAPAGWRVATAADWQTLVSFAGGDTVAGFKLKEIGNLHWTPVPSGDEGTVITPSTDLFKFTALPCGWRDGTTGRFYDRGWDAFWWTQAPSADTGVDTCQFIDWKSDNVFTSAYKNTSGLSVRCVRD